MLKLTEEAITLGIMKHLEAAGWRIVCFDYPQSGTGRTIYPDRALLPDGPPIIPDIVALKDSQILLLENKDRFYKPDFLKVSKMRDSGAYARDIFALSRVSGNYTVTYGIGGPETEHFHTQSRLHEDLVDIIVEYDGLRMKHFGAQSAALD